MPAVNTPFGAFADHTTGAVVFTSCAVNWTVPPSRTEALVGEIAIEGTGTDTFILSEPIQPVHAVALAGFDHEHVLNVTCIQTQVDPSEFLQLGIVEVETAITVPNAPGGSVP